MWVDFGSGYSLQVSKTMRVMAKVKVGKTSIIIIIEDPDRNGSLGNYNLFNFVYRRSRARAQMVSQPGPGPLP